MGRRSTRSAADTTGMWWQYRCHVSFALWKSPWSVDPSSTRASYMDYVRNGCQ
ncbi:DUF2599 domain-containing protein [Propioniciclava sp.]|uniref:DUF2599 domain-containing protein n=1 Tax=Propioniciclava sp. TaxID=2038686 RepID=UPI003FA6ADBA